MSIYEQYGFGRIIALPHANPKLAKSLGFGIMSAPLHLAPARLSGFNVCPMSTKGCRKACLHTAGNPANMAGKTRARIARTKAFYGDREGFMAAVVSEIAGLQRKADRAGMRLAIRLNATSDIRWEAIPVFRDGHAFSHIMRAFPDVIFYDYTKIANRRNIPPNYHLTFSLSENNDAQALAALANGMNVAVVFDVKKGQPLPEFFSLCGVSVPVLDGDEDDFRRSDPKRHIVGLRAKGAAKNDKSGFVRSAF